MTMNFRTSKEMPNLLKSYSQFFKFTISFLYQFSAIKKIGINWCTVKISDYFTATPVKNGSNTVTMNPVPGSLTLTNLITVICRIISCDTRYDSPVSESDRASSTRVASLLTESNRNNDFAYFENQKEVPPIVWTNSGRVEGYHMTIVRGIRVNAFEGIPYAQSPSGERRFRDPVPVRPWRGVLNTKSPGPVCLQLHYGRIRGTEDNCLTLNVYSKDLNPVNLRPVIVFIHGGFWISGSGSYFGPSYLLDNEVLLVTFNYRLGVLGFWTTGDSEALGNFGMKDQALVIKWVYENIANFGGDPNQITLSGTSAGGASTHFHMISNYPTRNQINSAISMSGTAYNIWALNRLNTSVQVSKEMASFSGCPTNLGSAALVQCMRKVDANVLVANQLLTSKRARLFIPSIEANLPGAFLTRDADEAYRLGEVARIPWIATMTSREINFITQPLKAQAVLTSLRVLFNTELAKILVFRGKNVNEKEVRRQIIRFYSGGTYQLGGNQLSLEDFSKIATDRFFTVPIRKAILMHSQIAPTYALLFNYSSVLGRAGRQGFNNPAEFGVFHGDDLVYFLNSTINHPPIRRYDSHFAVAKLLVNFYGNFARFREPLFIDGVPHGIWEKITDPSRLRFLRLDNEVKMIDDPYKKDASFWERLGIPDITPYFRLR